MRRFAPEGALPLSPLPGTLPRRAGERKASGGADGKGIPHMKAGGLPRRSSQ
jgi:hypothetical protein